MKVKLSKMKQGNTRLVSITTELLREAGFDPNKDLTAERYVEDGKIVFEISENDG